MLFGTFDILHLGHIHLFKQAKEYGDRLVVVVARDINVKKIKGFLPLHNEKERFGFLNEIKIIDEVLLGYKTNRLKIIQKVRPDVIALGYDQRMDVHELGKKITEFNLETEIVKLKPFQKMKHKTSRIKEYLEKNI